MGFGPGLSFASPCNSNLVDLASPNLSLSDSAGRDRTTLQKNRDLIMVEDRIVIENSKSKSTKR